MCIAECRSDDLRDLPVPMSTSRQHMYTARSIKTCALSVDVVRVLGVCVLYVCVHVLCVVCVVTVYRYTV